MRLYKDETRKEYKDVIFELQDHDRVICYDKERLNKITPLLKTAKSFLEYREMKELAEVGFCSFGVYKDGQCWLNLIRITDSSYKRYGIPSCMLMLMEKYASRRGAFFVEGKFIPESEGVEEFYNKNHYSIGSNGYRSMVEKAISIDDNYEHLKKYTDNIEEIKFEEDELIKTLDFYKEDEYEM